MTNVSFPPRLRHFIACIEQALAQGLDETGVLERVVPGMRELVAIDDWLPPGCSQPDPQYYRQFLLHRDAAGRFSVVSFVWGPGQATPIHDHLSWGVIGMLRGSELSQAYAQGTAGMLAQGAEEALQPGDVTVVSPRVGDIHRVRNAFDDRVSISIHAYGTDIGRQPRHVFDPATGAMRGFVSGYTEWQA